ncbi:Sec-independent protein translocase protein TatB [Sorangium sp. So ce375]|uniref:Sec-independent protein translocase protein TatB n=1 Tax=Sorangium sp. So ce375 TaxID=3133306 RepID=UPI003F5B59CD
MFGFSFGEIMVLAIVGIIVVGPRRLPAMMRTAGSWVAKLRRMTTDLRTQSGIDDLIRQEGLERELRELRALSRVNVIETLVQPVMGAVTAGTVMSSTPRVRPPEPEPPPPPDVQPLREREYPVLGCDAYGAELEGAPALPAAPENAPPAETAETTNAADATSVETTAGGAGADATAGGAGADATAGGAGADATAGGAGADATASVAGAESTASVAGADATAGGASAGSAAATGIVAGETVAAAQGVATGNGAAS